MGQKFHSLQLCSINIPGAFFGNVFHNYWKRVFSSIQSFQMSQHDDQSLRWISALPPEDKQIIGGQLISVIYAIGRLLIVLFFLRNKFCSKPC